MSVEVPGEVVAQTTNETVVSSIAEGLLIGAGAGVVSAIILGLYHLGRRRWLQRDQARYLRRCITESFAKIRANEVGGDLARDFPQARSEELRPIFFEEFMRHMTAAVSYRTTALSDNQIFGLQKAMTDTTALVSFVKYAVERAARDRGEEPPVGPGSGLPTDIQFYRNIYGYFARIKWLNLPEDMA